MFSSVFHHHLDSIYSSMYKLSFEIKKFLLAMLMLQLGKFAKEALYLVLVLLSDFALLYFVVP